MPTQNRGQPLRGYARAAWCRWSACPVRRQRLLRCLSSTERPMIGSDGEVPHLHSVLGDNMCAWRLVALDFLSSTLSILRVEQLLAGRLDSKLRYVLAHNFIRKLCFGSKKWRWLNQWMISNLRSIGGIRMPNFEVLDARIDSALNIIIHNTRFKRRISLEEQAQKQDRSFVGHWGQQFCRKCRGQIYSCFST